MKNLKIVGAILVLALVTIGATLVTVNAYGGWMRTPNNQQVYSGGMGYGQHQFLGPITQDTQTPTLYTPSYQGYGRGLGGCMGRWGNSASYPTTGTASTPLTINQASEIAKTYVASLNNTDLTVKEIEEYTNSFYVVVSQKSTGNGAFELLVDKYTGLVRPEPGPNMMWNSQYSFGAGYCNWAQAAITTTPTVTVEQAKTYAQQYLDSYLQGTTVGDVTAFSGHYTIEVLSNGTPYGLLSVNSFTGQVWYHTWHGAFVQEQTVS